jgi:hypothetical protein
VVDGRELRRDRAADLLGGRVGRAQLGELLLQRLERPQPLVEVGVGEGRVVEDVVAPARLLDLLGQLLVLLARLGRGRLGCFQGSHRAGSHRHGEQSPIWQAELSERPGWTPWRLAESWARPDLR